MAIEVVSTSSISFFEFSDYVWNFVDDNFRQSISAENIADQFIPNFKKPDNEESFISKLAGSISPFITDVHNYFSGTKIPNEGITKKMILSELEALRLESSLKPERQEYCIEYFLENDPSVMVYLTYTYEVDFLTGEIDFIFKAGMRHEDSGGASEAMLAVDKNGVMYGGPRNSGINIDLYTQFRNLFKDVEGSYF